MKLNKIIICVLVFLISAGAAGQDIYETIFLIDKKGLNSIKEIQAIEIPSNKDVIFIAHDSKYTYGYLYDTDHNLKGKLRSKKKNRNFINIGYSVAEDAVRIIQKDSKGYNYGSVIYDFEADAYSETLNPVDGRLFKYIETFNVGENTYIYLIKKKTSILKIIKFDIYGQFTFEELDLTTQFENLYKDGTTLYDFLNVSSASGSDVSMSKIDSALPTFIEIASAYNKMYNYNNGFIWSFDGDKEHTLTLQFDTPKATPIFKQVKKTNFGIDKASLKTNSFFSYPNLFQISSSSNKLGLQIRDYKTLNEIKIIELSKEDSITFKNSSIIQSSDIEGDEELVFEKTSKLLRKMSSYQNGIAVYPHKDGYQITIGGSRPVMSGIAMSTMAIGSGINPGQMIYNVMNQNTGSIRIECLFDNDFNHVKGEITDSTFDLIKDYSFRSNNTSANNLFYINNKLLFGIYYIDDKKIIFYEFDL